MAGTYAELKSELASELTNILTYWSNNTLDHKHGGFYGRIDHGNNVIPNASKGIILNTRILWSFSASSTYLKTNAHAPVCHRAYQYLKTFFEDRENQGVYWELDHEGRPINKRKQVYAQAFAIYALSEYYLFSKNEEAKNWAISLFGLIENHAKDLDKDGYLEAFNENWGAIKDMRLSNKDMNAAKTMNTHLHILEAYTSLLKIHDDSALKKSLRELVEIFIHKFLTNDHHYHLFFDEQWQLLSNSISYGHDIETAWLVIEAAKLLDDKVLLEQTRQIALKVANIFVEEAIDVDGGVINEKNLTTGQVDQDRHWWPQVEALIGLAYANTISPNQKYVDRSLAIWDFAKKNLIDHKNGEWFFRVDKNGNVYTEEDKVSMWKAPYHTTRACIMLNS